MQVESLDKLIENKPLLEKIFLAYWYSIPYDNDITPEKIELIQDNGTFFNIHLIRKNRMYGTGCIQKKEINNYLEKLKGLKNHELDIMHRFDTEAANK